MKKQGKTSLLILIVAFAMLTTIQIQINPVFAATVQSTYYFRDDLPTHGQNLGVGDVGTLLTDPPTTNETRDCIIWIQYWFDEEDPLETWNITQIYWHVYWKADKANTAIGYQCNGTYGATMDYNVNLGISASYVLYESTWDVNIQPPNVTNGYYFTLKLASGWALDWGNPFIISGPTCLSYVTFTYTPTHKLEITSSPTNVSFQLNSTAKTTPYSETKENGTYLINFSSSFARSGLTWTFTYWNDNTSNTNPIRTINLQSNSSYSVTYTSRYTPITFTGSEPVFECAMNNMFELDAITESMIGDVQRQMLLDSSSYANHGCLYPITTPYGGPSLTWGNMGKALEFDGVDDSVIIDNSDSLNISEAITIEFWFNAYNVTTNQTLMSKYSSGSGQWLIGVSNGQIYSKLWTTSGTEYGTAMTTYNITEGVFYFFTLTYDFRDGYYSMWLHGAPQQNVTTDGYKNRNVDVDLYLGNLGNSSSWFNGVLDEVRIFPYKRTEGQVYNDARNPIKRFGTWNFVASSKQEYVDMPVIATEGVIPNYTGLTTNDWQLPWAYANDTYWTTAIRSASYTAGFQSYQLYCNAKFTFSGSWYRSYIHWYWLFFRDGKLQVAYMLELCPIYAVGSAISKWHVRFVRSTSYYANVTMLDYEFNVNYTLYPNSIPIIVSAWIGPDNSHFTIRFDVQDSRLITAYDGSYATPFAYSFELVDENANPHLLAWFDGWAVSGLKIETKSYVTSWARMEIESHKFSWLAVAFIFFPVIVGGWIAYQAITSGKDPVTTIVEYSTEITNTLISIPEIVGTAVRTAGEPVRDAIAGLSHDIIAAVSGLGGILANAFAPFYDWFAGIAPSIVNALTGTGSLIFQAIIGAWTLYVGVIDALFAWAGSPFSFSTFVGWVTDAAGWVSASFLYSVSLFTSFFTFLSGWLTGLLEIVVAAFTWWAMEIQMVGSFLTGSYGVGVNFWTEYNLTTWIGLVLICYPIFLVFMWDEKGLGAVIEHVTFMYNSFHLLAYILLTIIHYVSSMITRLIEMIPVAE